MAFHFFTIPVQQSETATEDLNRFLRSHRILAVDRRWVDQGANSFWALAVDYLDHVGAGRGEGDSLRRKPSPLSSPNGRGDKSLRAPNKMNTNPTRQRGRISKRCFPRWRVGFVFDALGL